MQNQQFGANYEQDDNWGDFQQTPKCYQQASQEEDLLTSYQNQVNSLYPLATIQSLTQQKQKHHRISLATRSYADFKSHDYHQKSQPILKKVLHYGYHCVYSVTIGIFRLQINVLNVHRSSDDEDLSVKQDQLGVGGFGNVRSVKIGDQLFAIKRINFVKKREIVDQFDIEVQLAEKQQINRAIQQYGMYKICSMLGIGPQVIFRSNYDLICYNNCLEFLMQLCLVPSKCQTLPLDMLLTDLLHSLKTLHSFHFVHRDIKPDNILYSQNFGRFVLADFGLTHPIGQEYYESSQTFFAGTLQFMSPEMLQLSDTRYGKVNLYLNDFYSLRLTITKLQSRGTKSLSYQNSMSFRASIEQMGSFQSNYENNSSNFNSGQSLISTNQPEQKLYSNIFQKLLHSLDAPSRNASQINFYQSQILFEAFKIYECSFEINQSQLQAIIKKHEAQIEDEFVKSLVTRYVKGVFFPIDEQNSQLCLSLSYLKNAARHFGPRSLQVNSCIQDIIKQIDSKSNDPEALVYFTQLKENLKNSINYKFQQNQQFLQVLVHLRKYEQLIDYFLKFLKANALILQSQKYSKSVNYRLLCCLYIISQHSHLINDVELTIINDYFSRIFDSQQKNSSLVKSKQLASRMYTWHLIKLAVQNLLQREYLHLPIYIKALNFYLQTCLKPSRDQIDFYLNILSKIQQKLQGQSLKQVEIFCNKFYMVQLYCKLSSILENSYEKVTKIVTQLKILDSQSKVYYLLSLNRLTTFYINKGDIDQALKICEEINKELVDKSSKEINQLERFSIEADLYKHYGVCYLQQKKYQKAIQLLNKAKKTISENYFVLNFTKSIYQINSNIGLCQYRNKMYKQALNTYNRIISDFDKSKKQMPLQKGLVYRSILVIYIQMDCVLEQKPRVNSLMKNIVKYTVMTLNESIQKRQEKIMKCNQKAFNFFNITQNKKVEIFLMQTLRKYIKEHGQIFQRVYEILNTQLFDIYYWSMQMPVKALHCLSMYMESILGRKRSFTVQDIVWMNYYAQKLIDFKLQNKANIFLKKYLFSINQSMKEQRQKAFFIYHRYLKNSNSVWQCVTSELVKNKYELLSNCQFHQIKFKKPFNHNKKWQKLLQKWLDRLRNNNEHSISIEQLLNQNEQTS